MSNYRSDNSDSDAAASLPSVNVRFLAPDVEQLRTELIRLLKAKQLDSGRLVKLVQPYKDDVVQKALPYVMKRLIDKKDKDQSRAAVLREAIQDLETKHDFRFNWNPLYQCFLKGRPIPQRTTEADLTSIKAFFGDNYREELDLGAFRGQDESKCSKLRELKPLTALVEQLNLDKDEIIKYILAVRDARLQQKRRGRLSTVTGGDLQLVKEELQSLVWTTLKRPRSSVSASFTKRTPLSRKFIDDEASEAEDVGQQNSDQEVVVGTTQTEEDRELSPTLRSPSSNLARPTISIRSRQVANIVDSTDPPPKDRLSPEEKNRTAHKVPKGAFDLWRLRSLTFGPPVGTVPFAGWNDSAYVHGHTGSGQFIYDDESGSISATRLVGFHDPMKRQYGNDYLNSWIVLPNATFNLQGITWIALTQMLSNRQIESMDGNLSRRATGEIGLAQDL
jgi:hypothetical protein